MQAYTAAMSVAPTASYEAAASVLDQDSADEIAMLLRQNKAETGFGPKKRAAVLRYQAAHRCSLAEAHEACEAIEAALTA